MEKRTEAKDMASVFYCPCRNKKQAAESGLFCVLRE